MWVLIALSLVYATAVVICITVGKHIPSKYWATGTTSLVPTTFSCFPFHYDSGVPGEIATWAKPRSPKELGVQGTVCGFMI